MIKSINQWAQEVHTVSKEKGWHTTPNNDSTLRERLGSYLMNIHGEVSELWEAYRSGKLFYACDKVGKMHDLGLEPLTCAEEELADIVIRALDTAQAMNINIERAITIKHEYNKSRPHRHGGKLA